MIHAKRWPGAERGAVGVTEKRKRMRAYKWRKVYRERSLYGAVGALACILGC